MEAEGLPNWTFQDSTRALDRSTACLAKRVALPMVAERTVRAVVQNVKLSRLKRSVASPAGEAGPVPLAPELAVGRGDGLTLDGKPAPPALGQVELAPVGFAQHSRRRSATMRIFDNLIGKDGNEALAGRAADLAAAPHAHLLPPNA